MTIPDFLRQGDCIALAAPARKITREELAPATALLRHAGFQVYDDDRLFAEYHQFAGTDETRAQYFQDLLDKPEIKAIWCARGGYGSVRIIDKLDFTAFRRHPKWICGYSDITAFHAHINRNYDTATLHATMPVNVHNGEEDLPANKTFLDALQGKSLTYNIKSHPLDRLGKADAPIVGGNLSMLYSLLGSPSDIDTEGKILLIEEVDEYLYHIDRMMTNLERNGKLRGLAGLFVGHLTDMHDNTVPYGKTADEIIAEHCERYDFPLLFNVPCGHEADNLALPLGIEAHLSGQTIEIEL